MANKVFANGREISHKGSGGMSPVYPDVCKTPTPGGPLPIPFPNISTNDGARTEVGTKKVKVSGKTVMKGSKMSSSMGDEAGAAAKKGVISSRQGGKVYHQAWAMDVKVEGKKAALGLTPTRAVNGAPPVPCGNPECRFHKHPLPATQTARLPGHVTVEFTNRLVCLECYRKFVGAEPLPAGSTIAAPFLPGGAVVSSAMSGVGQLKSSIGA
jgi:hypothetical protein